MDKITVNGLDKSKSKLGLNMSTNDKLVFQIKEQISLAGAQVKQRMHDIKLELMEELGKENGNGNGNGVNLH